MSGGEMRVGDYILVDKWGQCILGEVWRAYHRVWRDEPVAIKLAGTPDAAKLLRRSTLHGLVHPNIVRIITADASAEIPYCVTEYFPGRTLRNALHRAFSPTEAIAILQQVLAGLSHAHKNGVVHGAISPDSVILDDRAADSAYAEPGMVKITGFGLCLGECDDPAAARPDHHSDIHDCGALLFELLTAQRPWPTQVPSEADPQLPRIFDSIYRRATAPIGDRFVSADQFSAALRRAALELQSPPPQDTLERRTLAILAATRWLL